MRYKYKILKYKIVLLKAMLNCTYLYFSTEQEKRINIAIFQVNILARMEAHQILYLP